MTDILDFKTYAFAQDCPGEYRSLGSTALRSTEDWFRLFEVAQEMVAKYGLDGSRIPIGATVMLAEKSECRVNRTRGYNGIVGPTGIFAGPVSDEKWMEHYFCVNNKSGSSWYYRPCWWRFLIVIPNDAE